MNLAHDIHALDHATKGRETLSIRVALAGEIKHFTGISDNNYRFFPLIVGPADLKRIHGTNERIAVDNYVKMIQFYTRLIQNISDTQSL